MDLQIGNQENLCSRADIAAYIDGELSPSAELELECHFAVCGQCKSEFNAQKKLLCTLDSAFVGVPQFELPKNFTKTIVVNAESKVEGLRSPKEFTRALLLCAALLLMIVAGLGGESGRVFLIFTGFLDQIRAVAAFLGYFLYEVAVALVTILRLITGQFDWHSNFAFVILSVFLAVVLYKLSLLMIRFNRTKI